MSKLIRAILMPGDRTSPDLSSAIEPLSEREREVLYWLASGASNREISQQLYITESTVKRHVYHIFGKLSVSNRTQAVLRALNLGINPGCLISDSQSWNETNMLKL